MFSPRKAGQAETQLNQRACAYTRPTSNNNNIIVIVLGLHLELEMIADISLMRLNSLAQEAAHLHNKDQKTLPSTSLSTSSLVSLIWGHHNLLYLHMQSWAVIPIFALHVKCQYFFSSGLGEQPIMSLNEKVLSVMIVSSENAEALSVTHGANPGKTSL